MKTPDRPGIYEDINEDQYNAIPALRSSTLREFMRATPLHFHRRSESSEKKPHFELGKALHLALLQPKLFADKVTCMQNIPTAEELGYENFLTKKAQEDRDKIKSKIDKEMSLFEIALPEKQWQQMLDMTDSAQENPAWQNLMDRPRKSELSLVWECPVTGILCKARLDGYFPEDGKIIELKHTKAYAMVDTFGKEILKYGYHQQAAFYLEGAKHLGLNLSFPQPFEMMVIENHPPYLSACRPLDFTALNLGQRQISEALRDFAECKRTNIWPGHSSEEVWQLPGYVATDDFTFGGL